LMLLLVVDKRAEDEWVIYRLDKDKAVSDGSLTLLALGLADINGAIRNCGTECVANQIAGAFLVASDILCNAVALRFPFDPSSSPTFSQVINFPKSSVIV
jgi:hypothetical protein